MQGHLRLLCLTELDEAVSYVCQFQLSDMKSLKYRIVPTQWWFSVWLADFFAKYFVELWFQVLSIPVFYMETTAVLFII